MRKTIYSVLAIILLAGTAAFAGVNHTAKAKAACTCTKCTCENTPNCVCTK